MAASNTEQVQKALKDHSAANIDEYVQASTFNNELEEAVRGHIHLEHTSWLWKRSAAECFSDGMFMEAYLVQRGGRSAPIDIEAPKVSWPDDPVDPVGPVYEALQVEKEILEDLLRLCKLADNHGDYVLEDVIESKFLNKETKHVKDLGDLLQECVRVSKQPDHGLYHLDKELRVTKGITPWGHANNPEHISALFEQAL